MLFCAFFFFQAEDGIRDAQESRGLGDVYKRQKYSRNLNPRWRIPQGVISLHLRGKHKPWFSKMLPNADPELGKKEFGFPYLEWWRLFEDHIHIQSEAFAAALYFEMYTVVTPVSYTHLTLPTKRIVESSGGAGT
eukprot:TRINITY_DN59081_c0_g1_i1.p2 TRINITY_DN59081_c0_g1~~TRINITY_DN59081_c0_g1_i1.p2  ORF type:complete len:135 (-),score=27.68 TRINITY_DN59081_c0_g1_i1:80-484(-)